MDSKTKWCGRGKHDAPTSEFSKRSKSADGLRATCKACDAAYYREYRQSKADSVRERQREWYRENRGRVLTRRASKYQEEAEAVKAKRKEHRTANREAYLRSKRLYRIRHAARIKEKRAAACRATGAARPKRQEKSQLYSANYKAKRRGAVGTFTPEQWRAKCEEYKWCCYLCGVSLEGAVIHVEHRTPVARGGSNLIENVAPACSACNHSKGKKTEAEFREYLTLAARYAGGEESPARLSLTRSSAPRSTRSAKSLP